MPQPESKQTYERPLNISLSGGGHRATLFSLGVFAFLIDAGLIGRVREISSVSGGSLTNGIIAAGVTASPKSWDEFTHDDWHDLIARASQEISGNDIFWKIAALGLITLGVFFTRALAWDVEGLTSVWFIAGSFAWTSGLLIVLCGVLGLDKFEILVSLAALALAWWVFYQAGPPALSIMSLNLLVVVTMIALSFLGARGRGSFWGHPLTWIYFSFCVWGLILGLYLAILNLPSVRELLSDIFTQEWGRFTVFLESVPTEFFTGVILIVVSASLFTQRNRIANIAFRRLVKRITEKDDFRLGDLETTQNHVFCATLVTTNTHIYFTNKGGKFRDLALQGTENRQDLIRKFNCKDLKLSKAMQMSSAFPGGFPYQDVRSLVGTSRSFNELLVSDGGIFDNSGTSWYFDIERDETAVEDLLVVDSAPTYEDRKKTLHKVPFLQDILSILGVIDVAMSAVSERRSFVTLQDDLYQDHKNGTHFHVMARTDPGLTSARLIDDRDTAYPENPMAWASLMQVIVKVRRHHLISEISNRYRDEFDIVLASLEAWIAKMETAEAKDVVNASEHAADLENLHHEVKAAFDGLYHQLENEDGTTRPLKLPYAFVSFKIPTSFRPFGAYDSSTCLRRGYIHTMRQMYLITRGQTPLFEPDSLDGSKFEALAKGRPLHS
ncbi:hypothetical protein [Roseobacter sp.]|uniref:hypothetical protein n=1 Tax=Roseobacter sp. TaxID=1907202 RepID=UPI0029661101|nr:hypothetical protein [Roseobacter sp.]MDW3182790.1 hypothetical protein [Roseobacter sp.]